ncbi:MAG: MTH938/NDUFAF3 family protein [Anaplasma ovis]
MVPIGVGRGFERFSRVLSSRLQRSSVRHEVMSITAACDTYNVLLHESEHVCAICFFRCRSRCPILYSKIFLLTGFLRS